MKVDEKIFELNPKTPITVGLLIELLGLEKPEAKKKEKKG